jgi:hypothetical protein
MGEVIAKVAVTRRATASSWQIILSVRTSWPYDDNLYLALGDYRIKLIPFKPTEIYGDLLSTLETEQDLEACGIDCIRVDETPIFHGRLFVDTKYSTKEEIISLTE